MKTVAERLGNTPAVCRKCYVHPTVLESYLTGSMLKILEQQVEREVDRQLRALRKEELDVLHLLEQRLSKAA